MSRFFATSFIIGAALVLAACGDKGKAPEPGASGSWTVNHPRGVHGLISCLEKNDIAVISAHRGGPGPGRPENSLAAFEATLGGAPAILEVDVAASRDGVLFLLHDDTLDRTTTGSGIAAEKNWDELASLYLKDADGRKTDERIPTLGEALAWAEGRTVFQLDIKRSARYEDVVETVKTAGAEDRVIYISYSIGQARKLSRLDRSAVLSVSVDTLQDYEEAIEAGLPPSRILAWTGNQRPRPYLFEKLEERDRPAIFGTLGPPSRSIDAQIARSGDYTRYAEIVSRGVDILATDVPLSAFKAIAGDAYEKEAAVCGLKRL